MCKIQREQVRHRQHGAQSAKSRTAHNLFQKLCSQQVMHFHFTSNRPTVRQQFGNTVICSTHNSLHLRPWYGYLRTMSLKQFLSPFLRVLMHVLTSSSVLAPSNVQELVVNAECNRQMPRHWRYPLQQLKNDEMLQPLTLSDNWLLMSCHSDEHQTPTFRTSVKPVLNWANVSSRT